jgi:hypothetical protein
MGFIKGGRVHIKKIINLQSTPRKLLILTAVHIVMLVSLCFSRDLSRYKKWNILLRSPS